MKRTAIYKLRFPKICGEHELIVPKDAQFLSCQIQEEVFAIWFKTSPDETRKTAWNFFVAWTGVIDMPDMPHVATLQDTVGLVWHIFLQP